MASTALGGQYQHHHHHPATTTSTTTTSHNNTASPALHHRATGDQQQQERGEQQLVLPGAMGHAAPLHNNNNNVSNNHSNNKKVTNGALPAGVTTASKPYLLMPHKPMVSPPAGLPRILCTSPLQQNHDSALHAGIKEQLRLVLTEQDPSTVLAGNRTKSLCDYYTRLIPTDKHVFLRILATNYGLNHSNVLQLTKTVLVSQERGEAVLMRLEQRLRQALVPRYQHLFTQISHLEGGVKFLVDLRSQLLSMLTMAGVDHDDPHLQAMNLCLRELLSLWFSVGFLQLRRITWESPCDMLQKISDYEAVHPIRNWADVKRRVGPYRRCFVYTHASMPREPVVVLHTALTKDISSSIQSIVDRTRVSLENNTESENLDMTEDANNINTAIFYSITSTQKGLQGVELGNYIIKNAVREVLSEFPHIYQFSSLSPIPGFRDWLLTEINKQLHKQDIGESDDGDHALLTSEERSELNSLLGCPPKKSTLLMLRKTLQSNSWVQDEQLKRALQKPLVRLCGRYLYLEKRRGYALNPVANFHLRNGAVMWRINWLADTTARGLAASCSLMVNYRYFLDQTEANMQQYMETKEIPVSEQVLQLVMSCTPSSYSSPASSTHSLSSS